MRFGEEIRNIRYLLLMSQEAFADELGVKCNTVNRWENGKTLPTMTSMGPILEYCRNKGFDTDALLSSWKEEIKTRGPSK